MSLLQLVAMMAPRLAISLFLIIYHQIAIAANVPNTRPSSGVQLYLAYENKTIPNFSMIRGGQFFDKPFNTDNVIDALWCQTAFNDSHVGMWFFPNGSLVASVDTFANPGTEPVFSVRSVGQIALARDNSLSGYEGLYTCIIPDESGTNQTLVVGIYRTQTYNENNGPNADPTIQFSLISTRDANPPIFTLTFNVSDGPPTDVNCTDGSNPFTIASGDLSRVVVNGTGFVTQVTMTVRMRQVGTYQCTVSNARVTNGPSPGKSGPIAASSSSISQPITVAGTPTGLNATRLNTGLTHVQLSWSSVSGVAGYQVFYQLSGGSSSVVSAGTTTNIILNIISGLSYSDTYDFFVVSYGSEGSTVLPSDHSNNATITLSPPAINYFNTTFISNNIHLLWTLPVFLPINYTIMYKCHRLCEPDINEFFKEEVITSNSTLHIVKDVSYGSQCIVAIIGNYGDDNITLVTKDVTTSFLTPTLAPSTINITQLSSRFVNISWNDIPCSGQNGPIIGYMVHYANTTFSDTVNSTQPYYYLTGLKPNTSYTVSIAAYNVAGVGPYGANKTITTAILASKVINFTYTIQYTDVKFMWSQPLIFSYPIKGYELCYGTSSNHCIMTTNTTALVTNILPNITYNVYVRAVTDYGVGVSSMLQIKVQISALLNVSFEFFDDALLIRWLPYSSLYISQQAYIVVQYKATNQDITKSISIPLHVSVIAIAGLKQGLEYTVQLYIISIINGTEYESDIKEIAITLPKHTTLSTSSISISNTTVTTPTDNIATSVNTSYQVAVWGLIGVICIILMIGVVLLTALIVMYKKAKNANNKYRNTANTAKNEFDKNAWVYCAAYGNHTFSFQSPLPNEEHELQQVEQNSSLYESITEMTVNVYDYAIIENQNV